MDLSHFRMLINYSLKNYPYIVPEAAPLIILYSKSAVFMAKNDKYNKHTRHIYRRINFMRNDENGRMNNIEWYEDGLQLAKIATNNVGETNLSPRIKHILVRIYN